MSEQVTVTLSDYVLECASQWSRQTGKPMEDVLAEAIELSLIPLGESTDSMESWADEDVIASVNATMDAADDLRLSELLDLQQRGSLTSSDADELKLKMQLYQASLLRKAKALQEAVRRGLRESIQS